MAGKANATRRFDVVREVVREEAGFGRQCEAGGGEGRLPGRDVRLHWFSRDDIGATSIASASLDDSGRFGDWPSDFDTVSLDAFDSYLNAVELRERKTG